MTKNDLYELACRVRRRISRLRQSPKIIPEYQNYDPHLRGWCGISSYILFQELKNQGRHPRFCSNNMHCFLKYKKWYLDITLSQFDENYPHVYIEQKPVEHIHVDYKTFLELEEIQNTFIDWPCEQNPFISPVIKLYNPRLTF